MITKRRRNPPPASHQIIENLLQPSDKGRTIVDKHPQIPGPGPHLISHNAHPTQKGDAVLDDDGNEISGTGEGHGPARYLTKIGDGWGLGSELAAGNMKQAKGRSMNPAQLVSTWVASMLSGHPDERLADVIRELHKATKGRQMTKISAKLRKWVAERTPEVDQTEQDDDEIINEEIGGEAVATLHPEVYTWVQRLGATPDVLEAAEDNGINGVIEALRNRGLPAIGNRDVDGEHSGSPPLITFGPEWLRPSQSKPRCKVRQTRKVVT